MFGVAGVHPGVRVEDREHLQAVVPDALVNGSRGTQRRPWEVNPVAPLRHAHDQQELVGDSVIEPLTAADTGKLLAVLPHDPYGNALRLALSCGTRLGEVLGLTRPHVHVAAGTLDVRKSLQKIARKPPALVDVKTDSGVRTIHLPAVAVAALEEEIARWEGKGDWELGPLVFRRISERRRSAFQIGEPLCRRQTWDVLQRALKVAGLEHKRVHDLRHGAASIQLEAGASLEEVKVLLGHSSIQVTSDFYAHVYDAARKAMANPMDAALRNGGPGRGSGPADRPRRKANFVSK
jgi:integrase